MVENTILIYLSMMWRLTTKEKGQNIFTGKEIQKYLISSSPSNQNYFENKLKDYFNYLLKKDYIENIVVVTFPHKAHIFEVTNSKKERIVYSVNV